jgi:purine-binding chemotaxis protein CheW
MNNQENDNILEQEIFEEGLSEIDITSLLELPNMSSSLPKESEGDKYVVFHLEDKIYGINSKSVAEVAANLPITALPNSPDWLLGLANLRGDIITVIDLRKLWKKTSATPHKSRLIVFPATKTDPSIAFLVDKLSEIVTLSAKNINFSASDFTDSFPTFFGKVEYKGQTLHLIDVDKIFSTLTINPSKT